VICWSR